MFKVVTDGAINMSKAFKDIFEVDVNLRFLDDEDDRNFHDESDDEELPEAELVVELVPSLFSDQNKKFRSAFPLRLKCFAHSLQLVIVDMYKKYAMPNSAYSKMTTLINHFGKSPLASQELKAATRVVFSSTAKTRWSSQIVLLKQFLEAEQTVVAIARAKGIDLPTRREFQFLHQIYSLMKIFIDVLQRVQAEKTVTISLGYGYLKIFSKSILNFKEKFPTSCELANGLQEIMDKRFQCFMNANCLEFDPIFMVAAMLDPNTAFQLTDEDYLIALSSVKIMIRIRQPESNENLPENRLLDATLDQLMTEYAMEQTSLRKQKEICYGNA